jgi:hypothetical protein
MTKSDGIIHDMTDKDIEEKIEQYLSVREEEKNKHGEVFTPTVLIEKMLDTLPSSVWSNHRLKWLDPANGIGNFPMVVYQRLMKGLKRWEPNDKKRSKHIIENMLYMVEINPKNVKIAKKIFGSNANICCANFETETAKCLKEFGVDKFDIIIGNPPFQDEISESDTTKPRKGGKNKLYERITAICLSLLNSKTNEEERGNKEGKGYLLFVTPDNIMTGNTNKAYEEIIKYNTLYISFNNIQKQYFPTIGISMCYFLIETGKKQNALKTTINNQENEMFHIVLEDRALNPIGNWSPKTEKMVTDYISSDRNDAVYNRGTSESDYTGGKYEVVYTPDKILRTNNLDLAPGLKIKKIILFESKPLSSGFIDMKGKYGVGPHTFYIPFQTETEGKLLERFFKSDVYKTLVKVSITSQYLKTSLISHLNMNKILLKRANKTKKALTTDDMSKSSISSAASKKHHSLDKKHKKTKTNRKGKGGSNNKKTLKNSSIFKFW